MMAATVSIVAASDSLVAGWIADGRRPYAGHIYGVYHLGLPCALRDLDEDDEPHHSVDPIAAVDGGRNLAIAEER
jgi:hypothetical protein